MKLSDVVGMVFCERMDFTFRVGQASLVGIFHSLRYRHFPSPPKRFTVYVALYDGEGEGTMEFEMERLETEETSKSPSPVSPEDNSID